MNHDTHVMLGRLERLGISSNDAWTLRRISMTLHRWHEMECGTDNGCIERDDATNKPYWVSSYNGHRSPMPDRERGAIKRLDAIMKNYPTLQSYIQTDPRGASLYILKPGDVPPGHDVSAYYNNGVAVYK